MFASKTLIGLLFTTALAFRIPPEKPCEYTYTAYPRVTTPERCAAKCSSYKGIRGDCFAWTTSLTGVSVCYLYFVKFHGLYRDGNNCGVNPVPEMNTPKTGKAGEAPGSESSISGCYVDTTTVDLGNAPTKYSCELSCFGFKTERYSACLLWFYDEHNTRCRGIVVEDSDDKACGVPSTMPV